MVILFALIFVTPFGTDFFDQIYDVLFIFNSSGCSSAFEIFLDFQQCIYRRVHHYYFTSFLYKQDFVSFFQSQKSIRIV